MTKIKVGVLGAGSMGSGIAQVAAQNGHEVVLVDSYSEQLVNSKSTLAKTFEKLVQKEKVTAEDSKKIQNRIQYSISVEDFASCGIIIEAIVENLEIKKTVFSQLESIVAEDCILASNTSSL